MHFHIFWTTVGFVAKIECIAVLKNSHSVLSSSMTTWCVFGQGQDRAIKKLKIASWNLMNTCICTGKIILLRCWLMWLLWSGSLICLRFLVASLICERLSSSCFVGGEQKGCGVDLANTSKDSKCSEEDCPLKTRDIPCWCCSLADLWGSRLSMFLCPLSWATKFCGMFA